MLDLIEKRLSLFGNPGMFMLPEGNSNLVRTVDYGDYFSNISYVKTNDQQAYGLFFTPNGNIGRLNHVGDKRKHSKSDCEEYISSLYVDIDMRDSSYSDPNKLLQVTLDTIWNDKIPVQYLVKSGGGFHLYMFVQEDMRYAIGATYANKLKEIQEELAKSFEGGCTHSHSMNKLMRVPFSKYRRSTVPKQVTLHKVIWGTEGVSLKEVEGVQDIYIDDKLCLSDVHLSTFIDNTMEIKYVKSKGQEYIGDIGNAQINAIPIADVIEKLKKYPRDNLGMTYEFSLKGNRIVFRINGQAYIPDGYKINRDKNYVHNFTFQSHPKEERPRGPVFPFLYNYFKKDITLLNKFLTEEYGISLKAGDGEESYICLPTETGFIYFTDKGVFYGKKAFNKKAKTYEDIQIKLFDMPMYIKGIVKTDYDLFGETEDENIYYMFQNPKKDGELMIEYTTDRKAFNKKYGKKGLIFLGSEFDLIDLYNAINKAAESNVIKQYDLRYLNGYYPDCYIIGDDVYDRYGASIDITDSNQNLIIKTQSVGRTRQNKNITVAEFGEKLKKVFSNRLSLVSLTTFIALMLGHKFRVPLLKGYKQQVLIPGLFLSGVTKSGKTSLLTILKNGMETTYESRKYSVIGTSPQPLKQASTDDFILHLEEFTGNIGEHKETILRDILNKARTGRGQTDGSNVYYIFRSSVILDGEHMPKSESVANRCVVIPMFDTTKDKIGTEKTLADMIGVSFLKDFINKTYQYKQDEVLRMFKDAESRLRKEGISDRSLLLYTFLLTVNTMFSIFEEEELIDSIKENIELHQSIDRTNNVLGNLLSELIIKNKINPTITEQEGYWSITLPYTMDLRAQNKVMFIDIMQQYPHNIKVVGNNLTIKIFTEKGIIINTKENVMVYNTILPYKTYFKVEHFLNFIEGAINEEGETKE